MFDNEMTRGRVVSQYDVPHIRDIMSHRLLLALAEETFKTEEEPRIV